MKVLKISVLTGLVLLMTGCAATGNIYNKVTQGVTDAVTNTVSFVSNTVTNIAYPEEEMVSEEPQLIGYEVVEMKNAKNSYSYPYGYYQAKPKYTTPNLGLSPGTEPGEWYRPNQQFYESQVPVGYVENTKHDILDQREYERSKAIEYSIIGHDNRDLTNAAIGVKPGALIKPLQ